MTIYNGIDTDFFVKGKRNQIYFKKFNFPMDALIIGSVARLSIDKDHHTLVKAFYKLSEKNEHLRLLIIGDGETRGEIEQLINDLKIQSKIVITGLRKDVPELLDFIDIFVLATHTEGISISLLEAMAKEKPVIATKVGGNSEILKDLDNGLLVEESDVEELSMAIESLVENLSERVRLSEKGRQTVLEKFNLNNTVKQYEKLYYEFYK